MLTHGHDEPAGVWNAGRSVPKRTAQESGQVLRYCETLVLVPGPGQMNWS